MEREFCGKSVSSDKRESAELPSGTLTPTGIRLIKDLLPYGALPNDFDFRWLVQGKGEYIGTLPKRISKFMFKTYDMKLDSATVSQIGNIASLHSSKESATYTFTIDPHLIDWKFGIFGDEDSCMRSSRRKGLELLEEINAVAIKFWDADDNPKYRIWCVPNVPYDNTFIIFNGYGNDSHGVNVTLRIAQILSAHFGISYKKIELSNNGIDHGDNLWINGDSHIDTDGHGDSGAGIGYILGLWDVIKDMDDYDLKTPESTPYAYCQLCDTAIESEDDAYVSDSGCDYCHSCYHELFARCYHCDSEIARDDAITNNWNDYCEDCFDRLFTTCDCCEESIERDDITVVDNGDSVCSYCLNRHYFRCDDCDNWLERDCQLDEHDRNDVNKGDQLCADCYKSRQRDIEIHGQGTPPNGETQLSLLDLLPVVTID